MGQGKLKSLEAEIFCLTQRAFALQERAMLSSFLLLQNHIHTLLVTSKASR